MTPRLTWDVQRVSDSKSVAFCYIAEKMVLLGRLKALFAYAAPKLQNYVRISGQQTAWEISYNCRNAGKQQLDL